MGLPMGWGRLEREKVYKRLEILEKLPKSDRKRVS
jgi:hypothetical protein